MPLCVPKYDVEEELLNNGRILLRRKICTIFGEGDFSGDYPVMGGPAIISYTLALRGEKTLKTAYVKIGNVPLGWFSSTEEQGIFIEEKPLPEPFQWTQRFPSLDKLVDCDIPAKIREEFGIDITKRVTVRYDRRDDD